MSNDKGEVETRVRTLEVRFAYLTGAAVVGAAAILAFFGVTSIKTIPAAVDTEVKDRIGEVTLAKITTAAARADSVLEVSDLRSELLEQLAAVSDRSFEATLVCRTIHGTGRDAACPDGFVITGCSAGGNRGSIDLNSANCRTHDAETDWTQARCCKVELSVEQ